MSTPDASYEVVAHRQAKAEFDAIPQEPRERLRELIHEMASCREPAEAPKATRLDGRDGLYRVRAGRYRCVLALDSPELKLLTADHRDRAYESDRLAVAEQRREE